MRRTYRADLQPTDSGMEQSFTANVVHVEETGEGWLVALGDLSPPPEGQPINAGTPIHSLLLQLSDEPEYDTVELNDQGNQRGIGQCVKRIELTATSLRVIFLEGQGPYAGRVSLSEELEFLEDEVADDVQLASVRVTFTPIAADPAMLEKALRESAATGGLLSVAAAQR